MGWLAGASLAGLALYVVLLGYHLAKFETIAYCVPNVAGWAGRYPGFGWTWALTAINLPADLASRITVVTRYVRPQVVAFYDGEFEAPAAWSATTWVVSGVVGYALAGLAVGILALGGVRLHQRWR